MRISTGINYSEDFKAAAEMAQAYEAAGVDMVWIAEAYGFDAVSILGFLAASTETIELGSGILNTYSRTPACLAQTAAGLDALSDGRFTLGLGASGPQVIEGFHGMPYKAPLTRWKEIIEICRMAWRREKLVHDGKAFTLPLPADQGTGLGKPLKIINHLKRDDIPIHIAALGHKSVEAAAELANGWLPFLFDPSRYERVWGDDLKSGFSRRDPSLGTFDIVAGGIVAIGDGAERYRDLGRGMAALYIGGMGARGKNFYNTLACEYGYEDAAAEIQDLYLSGHKTDAEAAVPAELLEGASICGDEGYVRDKLAQLKEAGVTTLNVTPVGGEPAAVLAKLRELADA